VQNLPEKGKKKIHEEKPLRIATIDDRFAAMRTDDNFKRENKERPPFIEESEEIEDEGKRVGEVGKFTMFEVNKDEDIQLFDNEVGDHRKERDRRRKAMRQTVSLGKRLKTEPVLYAKEGSERRGPLQMTFAAEPRKKKKKD